MESDTKAGTALRGDESAYGYRGRCDSLILAPRERHRQGTGVELSWALAVCVLTRRSTGGLGSLGAFPESHPEPGSVFGLITGDPDPRGYFPQSRGSRL